MNPVPHLPRVLAGPNHLISLSEVLAMYLLVWSPVPWKLVEAEEPALPISLQKRYRREAENIGEFVSGLPVNAQQQDLLIDKLLDFRGWQYTLATTPAIVVLDTRTHRWLFAPWSRLNLLTQRRSFHVYPRLPEGRGAGERLWNHSGIGDVRSGIDERPVQIRQLNAINGETEFKEGRRKE